MRSKRYWEISRKELIDFFGSLDREKKTFKILLSSLLKSEVILRANHKEEIVGIACIKRKKILPLLLLVVKSDFQGIGIGNNLMQRLQEFIIENRYKLVVLSVMKSNINAIKLYKKFGFDIFYKKNEDYYMILIVNKRLKSLISNIKRLFLGK